MSLNNLQSATDRKTVCDDAIAEQASQSFLDAQAAQKQQAYQAHFAKVINNWVNTTDTSSTQAAEGTLTLPINEMVDSSCLDGWETDLEAAGYTVTRNGRFFTITIP